MTAIDELHQPAPQLNETAKFIRSEAALFAFARDQTAAARAAVSADTRRVQDRLAKVWTILLPVKREHMPNGKLWGDLIAIKNRMVFYNPGAVRPNKTKASLSLMRDEHAAALKEMICELDTDLRVAT